MIKTNRKYKTESGLEVTIFTTSAASKWPVVGLIEGHTFVHQWSSDGILSNMNILGTHLNLVVPRTKHKRYINVYVGTHGESYTMLGRLCDSPKEAKERILDGMNFVGVATVEWETEDD